MADAENAPLKKEKKKREDKPKRVESLKPVDDRYKKEQEYLDQEFDPNKKYTFELAVENMVREMPVIISEGQRSYAAKHRRFPPFRNIVLTSQIIWKGQRRNIRYYDGCTSIFVDEQPKEKEEIDQLISQTRKRNFLEGKFGCYGDERQLLIYLNICSWNANSPFRTRSADAIFVSVDQENRADKETLLLDQTEEALLKAKEASDMKMRIHAAYLEIDLMDWDTEAEKTEKQLRSEYRRAAIANPAEFIKSYGNKDIELKYFIDKAIEKGWIGNKQNPNKLCWKNSGREIVDISGLKSAESISQKVFEFAKMEEGAEFVLQLQALFKE